MVKTILSFYLNKTKTCVYIFVTPPMTQKRFIAVLATIFNFHKIHITDYDFKMLDVRVDFLLILLPSEIKNGYVKTYGSDQTRTREKTEIVVIKNYRFVLNCFR